MFISSQSNQKTSLVVASSSRTYLIQTIISFIQIVQIPNLAVLLVFTLILRLNYFRTILYTMSRAFMHNLSTTSNAKQSCSPLSKMMTKVTKSTSAQHLS